MRTVYFVGVPPQAAVTVYNVRGELVAAITADSTGTARWDLSSGGFWVAHGTYPFRVKAAGTSFAGVVAVE